MLCQPGYIIICMVNQNKVVGLFFRSFASNQKESDVSTNKPVIKSLTFYQATSYRHNSAERVSYVHFKSLKDVKGRCCRFNRDNTVDLIRPITLIDSSTTRVTFTQQFTEDYIFTWATNRVNNTPGFKNLSPVITVLYPSYGGDYQCKIKRRIIKSNFSLGLYIHVTTYGEVIYVGQSQDIEARLNDYSRGIFEPDLDKPPCSPLYLKAANIFGVDNLVTVLITFDGPIAPNHSLKLNTLELALMMNLMPSCNISYENKRYLTTAEIAVKFSTVTELDNFEFYDNIRGKVLFTCHTLSICEPFLGLERGFVEHYCSTGELMFGVISISKYDRIPPIRKPVTNNIDMSQSSTRQPSYFPPWASPRSFSLNGALLFGVFLRDIRNWKFNNSSNTLSLESNNVEAFLVFDLEIACKQNSLQNTYYFFDTAADLANETGFVIKKKHWIYVTPNLVIVDLASIYTGQQNLTFSEIRAFYKEKLLNDPNYFQDIIILYGIIKLFLLGSRQACPIIVTPVGPDNKPNGKPRYYPSGDAANKGEYMLPSGTPELAFASSSVYSERTLLKDLNAHKLGSAPLLNLPYVFINARGERCSAIFAGYTYEWVGKTYNPCYWTKEFRALWVEAMYLALN